MRSSCPSFSHSLIPSSVLLSLLPASLWRAQPTDALLVLLARRSVILNTIISVTVCTAFYNPEYSN